MVSLKEHIKFLRAFPDPYKKQLILYCKHIFLDHYYPNEPEDLLADFQGDDPLTTTTMTLKEFFDKIMGATRESPVTPVSPLPRKNDTSQGT